MRIGIDAGPLLGQGGISGYVGPLVRTLLDTDFGAEFRLVYRRGWRGSDMASHLEPLAPTIQVRVPDRFLDFWWNRVGWPLPLYRVLWQELDLFLATSLLAPVLPSGQVVSIVYDLTPLRLPALFPDRDRFRDRLLSLIRRSAALVAISHRTREDLVALLGADPLRVRVIYPGRDEACRPVPPEAVAPVTARYKISGRYLLYVGSLGPHKNVITLLHAYERARSAGLPAKLVLVTSPRWGEATLAALDSLRVRDDIIVTGSVPGADLAPLYSGADCFVFPSRYEGFGLPVLEAMACGTPVIASTGGALPEVVGDAGAVFDPEDPIALAETMCRIVGDVSLRAGMTARGLARAAQFSWRRSAEELQVIFCELTRGTVRHV